MQVYVTAAAVVGGIVEDDLNSLHGGAGDAGLAQVGLHEGNAAVLDMIFDIRQASARKVVHHMDASAAFDEGIDQMGANEGTPAGDKYLLIAPDGGLRSQWVQVLR